MAADEKGMKRSGRGKERGTRGEMAEWGRVWRKRGSGIWMEEEKMYRGKEQKCDVGGRVGLGEDAGLHPQLSVRLHKYWVHWRVAGSQVSMTYEYCRSHSLPSCPSQLLMSSSEFSQLFLEAFLSTPPENKWETHIDELTDRTMTGNKVPLDRDTHIHTHARAGDIWPSMQAAELDEIKLIKLISAREIFFLLKLFFCAVLQSKVNMPMLTGMITVLFTITSYINLNIFTRHLQSIDHQQKINQLFWLPVEASQMGFWRSKLFCIIHDGIDGFLPFYGFIGSTSVLTSACLNIFDFSPKIYAPVFSSI